MPVAQNEGVNPFVLQPQPNGVFVGYGRFAAGDVDRVSGGTKRGNELAERRVQIVWHFHQRQAVIDAGIGQQHAGTAGTGNDHNVLALGSG